MHRLIHVLPVLLLSALAAAPSARAQNHPAVPAVRQWRQAHEHAIVSEFVSLLRVPNVTRDRANIQKNAELIADMLRRRGVEARLVTEPNANPVVFGEIRMPGATRTVVFYAHYDGQPLDPAEWATPPFEPTLRTATIEQQGRVIPMPQPGTPFDPEWRLYARSSGDDKVPIMAIVSALDAIKAAGLRFKSNIKFAFEGEEEAGSPNLERILAANRELFSGDVWLMCDAPLHQTRRQMLYFGARDGVRLDLTVYGAKAELHSGHYGNWAPNPAMLLAKLLASMKDDSGRVLVDGFYEGIEPLSPLERRAIAEAPVIDDDLRREFQLGGTDGGPKTLAELVTEPSLNIRGMASSRVGELASNVIPSTATASIDIRLVKGMDGRRTQERVIDHIRKQGFFVTDTPASPEVRQAHPRVVWVDRARAGLGAVRTPMDWPLAQEVIRTVQSVRGTTILLPNMGGNLPLANVERPLGTRTIIVPIANHDDNQHSFDENLRLQNLWDGIELMAGLLLM